MVIVEIDPAELARIVGRRTASFTCPCHRPSPQPGRPKTSRHVAVALWRPSETDAGRFGWGRPPPRHRGPVTAHARGAWTWLVPDPFHPCAAHTP
ncbi:MAG: hypothetical protein D6705_07485 [Deltaproteobacteria bacterium]|nr:MAG: hypothetical protein D6705_07485 [Deltaproteobacteria bacterium]